MLVTIAEAESVVTVRTAAGAFAGKLSQVTAGFCAVNLDAEAGPIALIPISAITAVEGSHGEIADERAPDRSTDLPGALAGLAPDRPPVKMLLRDGTEVVGTLITVGADVAVVRTAPDALTVVHIPLQAIAACVLL